MQDFIETELPVEALTAGGPLTIEIDGPLIRPLLIDLPESAVSQIARVLRASWDQPPTISSMEQLGMLASLFFFLCRSITDSCQVLSICLPCRPWPLLSYVWH